MITNKQPIEAKSFSADGALHLHSVFLTLQGEGPFSGERAVFIRLAGCNLQCPGCDTDYTSVREVVTISEITSRVDDTLSEAGIKSDRMLIVLTGGEPFRQDCYPLCYALIDKGFRVQIETNGVLPPPDGIADLLYAPISIVVSPKTSRINSEVAKIASAFKYVIRHGEVSVDDGLPTRALGHKATPQVARPPASYNGPIFVNPMDEQEDAANEANLDAAAHSALVYGHKLGVQIHKYAGLD
jgi:organic radical activating enzyme